MTFQYPKLVRYGLIHALGVVAYTSLVSLLMSNGERLFGKAQGFAGGAAILLLFVLSAAVTSLLVFGKPVALYLNGAETEAIYLLLYTIGWLAVLTLIIFSLLVIW